MTEEITEKALEGTWYCFQCKQPVEVTLTCIKKNTYRIQANCPEKHHIVLVFTGEIGFATDEQLKELAKVFLHIQLDDVAKGKGPKQFVEPDIYRQHVISGMTSLTGLNGAVCEEIIDRAIVEGSVLQSQKPVKEKIKKGKDVLIQQVEMGEEE